MYILGISAFYHDSAACIIKNDEIVAAAQEERFTRKKHDPGFPQHAIEYCLSEANITANQIDNVVFYEKPFVKFERLLETYLAFAPRGFKSFALAMPVWIKNKLFQKLWDPKVLKILNTLSQDYKYKDQFFECDILWGDARETINNIPANLKFDLIYLDGFSPQKCPQIWSVEFLEKVIKRINKHGYLITYSSAAAIRKTLRNFGLDIFNIKPNFISKNFWSNGTVAIKLNEEENQIRH